MSGQSISNPKFLSQIKRRAKELVRDGVDSHVNCLERLAREHGFRNYWELRRAALTAKQSAETVVVRFMMDMKDVDGKKDRMSAAGMVEDPEFNLLGQDATLEERENAVWDVWFRFVGEQPQSEAEAFKRVTAVCFFPPERVFIGDQEVDPAMDIVDKNGQILRQVLSFLDDEDADMKGLIEG